jgi:hypothetical protein
VITQYQAEVAYRREGVERTMRAVREAQRWRDQGRARRRSSRARHPRLTAVLRGATRARPGW